MLSSKPLPRSALKFAAKRQAQRDDRAIKAQIKARDQYRCRVTGSRDVLDVHEEKRRGAGGKVSLANSYTVTRVAHDLLQSRHIVAEQDGETFDANLPIRFVTSQKVADLLFPSGRIPPQVHVIPEGV
jgi:hypothetical protein